jgi:RNA polymerase sigma-70 factor (ECF subfamily)
MKKLLSLALGIGLLALTLGCFVETRHHHDGYDKDRPNQPHDNGRHEGADQVDTQQELGVLPERRPGSGAHRRDRGPSGEPRLRQMTGGGAGTAMDPRALFEETVYEHLHVLRALALKMTRNEDDAQDLLQDTLLRAFRGFHTYRPDTNCRAWLCRILKNTCINRYRKVQRRPAEVDFESVEETRESHIMRTARQTCDPEEALLKGRLRESVCQAFAELSPPYQQTIALSVVGGYSYHEIARVMGCPIGTVMSRKHRARKLAQEILRPVLGGLCGASM